MTPASEEKSVTAGVVLRAVAGSAFTLLAMDAVWLSQIAASMYRDEVGELMGESTRWDAVVAFYLLYVAGIVALAVLPALTRGAATKTLPDWASGGKNGAILGFVAYGTFGFTNLAVLEAWTLPLVLIDLVWGVVLTASSAAAGVLAGGR